MCWALKRADSWLRASPSSTRLARPGRRGLRVQRGLWDRRVLMVQMANKVNLDGRVLRVPLEPLAPQARRVSQGRRGKTVKTALMALRVQWGQRARTAQPVSMELMERLDSTVKTAL